MTKPTRSSRRWTVAGAAALVAGALLAQGGSALDPLELDGGLLAWDGIRLGMTIPQLERRVGATLALEKSKEPGCPVWVAHAEHHGLTISIGLPTPKPSAKTEWIRVRFEGNLIQASGADLVAAIQAKFPGAKWVPPADSPAATLDDDLEPDFSVPGKEAQILRIYPREAMVLAKQACLG